ncbi:MAG: ABC transporter ATP-binding protein [Candidatus Thorarchaeota archaeon]
MTDYSTNAINVDSVSKRYSELDVLRGVSLQIEQGEFYILMGPNGSGKSTLVSIIAGTNSSDSGSVRILGDDIMKDRLQARRHFGYVPQGNYCSTFLTGTENLRYFAGVLGLAKSESMKQIADLLEMMGLTSDADRRVSVYSGGMRKKLEVAAALLGNPKILLLDEPTTGLDPRVRREFLELLSSINKAGTTVLLVTHIGEDAEMGSRVGFMVDGAIVVEDSPAILKETSGIHDSIVIDARPHDEELHLLLAGLDEDCAVVRREEGYLVCCDGAMNLIPRVIEVLSNAGYEILRIEANPSSLEDVFYRLTDVAIQGEVQ